MIKLKKFPMYITEETGCVRWFFEYKGEMRYKELLNLVRPLYEDIKKQLQDDTERDHLDDDDIIAAEKIKGMVWAFVKDIIDELDTKFYSVVEGQPAETDYYLVSYLLSKALNRVSWEALSLFIIEDLEKGG